MSDERDDAEGLDPSSQSSAGDAGGDGIDSEGSPRRAGADGAAGDADDDHGRAGEQLAADESEREPVAVGAVSRAAAGSARAEARRSAAATTARKGTATQARDGREVGGNIFVRIRRYLREVVAEMVKVIWPTRKEMVTYAIVVVLFLVFMVALTAGLDVGFSKGVLQLFG